MNFLLGKAFIIGGHNSGTNVGTVIDLSNKKLCLPFEEVNFSKLYSPSVGVVDQSYLIVCNGIGKIQENSCEILDGNRRKHEKIPTDIVRFGTAIQWSDSSLWITGSTEDKSTIVVSRSGYKPGQDLPEIRFGHCGLRIDSKIAIIIGGMIKKEPYDTYKLYGYPGQSTKTTQYFDFESYTWSQGPEMMDARVGEFGCTMFTLNDQPMIAVANGIDKVWTQG